MIPASSISRLPSVDVCCSSTFHARQPAKTATGESCGAILEISTLNAVVLGIRFPDSRRQSRSSTDVHVWLLAVVRSCTLTWRQRTDLRGTPGQEVSRKVRSYVQRRHHRVPRCYTFIGSDSWSHHLSSSHVRSPNVRLTQLSGHHPRQTITLPVRP